MERRISDQEPNSFPQIFPVIVTRSSWCDGLPSPPSPFFSWWCERIWLVRANVAITDFKNLTSKMQNTICWLFGMKSHKSITKPENRSTFRPCMQLSIGHFTYHEFEAHLQGAPSRVAKTSVRMVGSEEKSFVLLPLERATYCANSAVVVFPRPTKQQNRNRIIKQAI